MDRRNFIKSLMASGVLGASPLASQAASELFNPGAAQPVLIVGQSGLPHVAELVAGLGQVFATAGIRQLQVTASGSELTQFGYVSALLDRVPGGRAIGVMDDAAGVIFQELAAARGAACVLSAHHRFGDQQVRHCCTSAGLESSIVWSDALPNHAERISRLYAGTLGGPAFAPGLQAPAAVPGDGAPASLVSFLINT